MHSKLVDIKYKNSSIKRFKIQIQLIIQINKKPVADSTLSRISVAKF